MRYIITLILIGMTSSLFSQNFHQFKAENIDGKLIDMASFKGKKLMIVNVASKCGLTPQYADLQKLYEQYKDKNFEIIAFPANNFLSQEPGSNAEIKQFCTGEFNVSFTMMSKISVKGDDIHPIYQWLTEKEKNGKLDAPIKWNFQKFLIDENGNLYDFLSPREKPMSEKVTKWLNGD
ncbi:MAG: glutathione peroxidase [Bacteroidales bacterium]|nr:glutathione peroxidase [Bacteroidales bacterium]